jgi:hypothetical protein
MVLIGFATLFILKQQLQKTQQREILDIEAQNWLDIYNLIDPDQQLQHLNKIVLWLFGLHAPLR